MRSDVYGGNRVPTKRQSEVIALVALGLKNKEIAQKLETTEHVIKNYLRIIYDKLGLWNRVELALWHVAREGRSNEETTAAHLLPRDRSTGLRTASTVAN